ncbi:hypothetical protein GCM10010467_07760 [Actinocorallia glomerata]|uniref:Uncharacterized protein n=2 Tax=Actinomycetes TaxID=1760 RepID=A0ABP6LWR7_9MICC
MRGPWGSVLWSGHRRVRLTGHSRVRLFKGRRARGTARNDQGEMISGERRAERARLTAFNSTLT